MFYTFIVNPNARSGLGRQVWDKVKRVLDEKKVDYEVYYTKYQRHATKLVRQITGDGKEHTIIILGGDGTVDEVVNGITDLKKVALGYIPIGSSNDFARYFQLPADPEKAIAYLIRPEKYATMNLGVLTYGKEETRRRFSVSCGLGFDAAVCHQVSVSRLKLALNKLHLGRLVYVGIAISQMLTLKPAKVTVWSDAGEKVTYKDTFFVACMNHPYEGGGFLFCPKASPCDDILDVTIISGVPKWKALLVLPLAFKGKHVNVKGVHIMTCKKVIIESDRPLALHTDGEPLPFQKRIKAELEEEKVKLIIG